MQELVNSSWAFAKVAFCDQPLMAAIAMSAASKSHRFVARDLANIAWAFAVLVLPGRPLLRAAAAEMPLKLPEGDSQAISNSAWALTTLLYHGGPAMSAISAAALAHMNEFDEQGCSTMAFAFAALGPEHEPLLNAIATQGLAVSWLVTGACRFAFAQIPCCGSAKSVASCKGHLFCTAPIVPSHFLGVTTILKWARPSCLPRFGAAASACPNSGTSWTPWVASLPGTGLEGLRESDRPERGACVGGAHFGAPL